MEVTVFFVIGVKIYQFKAKGLNYMHMQIA